MDLPPDLAAWRPWTALTGLALLLGAECVAPFRAPLRSKLRHVATNLTIAGGNAAAVTLLVGGLLVLWSRRAEVEGWGLLPRLGLAPAATLLGSVVLLDLVFYFVHRLNHRIPLLWRFHRAHHGDQELDVSSALRFHPGEVLISTAVKAGAVALLGVPPAGLVLFEMTLAAAAQFQHSNLRLPCALDETLLLLVVTPRMHWIHHSRRPQDHHANFGTILSCWDRLLGTCRLGVAQEEVRIGLDEYRDPAQVGLLGFLATPVGEACRRHPESP